MIIIFAKAYSAWGYGTWKNKMLDHDAKRNLDYPKSIINKYKNVKRLNAYGDIYLAHTINMIEQEHLTGDTILV